MSRLALFAAVAALAFATIPGMAQAAPPADTAAALRDKALSDPTAYAVLESLTTEVGPRPAGSPAQKRAMEWGVATFKALGLQNVHTEPFTVNAWVRKQTDGDALRPMRRLRWPAPRAPRPGRRAPGRRLRTARPIARRGARGTTGAGAGR